jgi:hypothetical protein
MVVDSVRNQTKQILKSLIHSLVRRFITRKNAIDIFHINYYILIERCTT